MIAAPVAWLIMHRWLDSFAYRSSPGAGVFLAALAVSAGVALITIAHQSVRATVPNPVRSIRNS